MELKQQLSDIFNELYRHLTNFIDMGKSWVKEAAKDAHPEYINLVNVKCGWAKSLNQKLSDLHTKMVKDIDNKTQWDEDMMDMYDLLLSIKSLIITSVNLVPYTDIDEFYNYVYKVDTQLLTEITNTYHSYV